MPPSIQRFRVRLERPDGYSRGAGFYVPAQVMAAFAPQKRVPVVVTINGYTWRSTVSPYGGQFVVPVRSEVCATIGADAGDTVSVAMQLDGAVRRVAVPPDLARALNGAGARQAFDGLSYTEQKEHVQGVAAAKRPETRQRRIESAVARALRPTKRKAP